MLYTGIDLLFVNRFKNWQLFSEKKLKRLFSTQEIRYCLTRKEHSAVRFAVRFAAKEALFKAISQYDPEHTIPFLTFLAACEIQKTKKGIPAFSVNWHVMVPFCTKPIIDTLSISLSLSHDREYAVAAVLLSVLTKQYCFCSCYNERKIKEKQI